jgi:hypothetical protein
VKYHEALGDPPAPHRPRYDELATFLGCFNPEVASGLRSAPLQQIWRDHLLAGSLLKAKDFDEGFFAFLYPEKNKHCADALRSYRACLRSTDTFETWTLESFTRATLDAGAGAWASSVVDRYLASRNWIAYVVPARRCHRQHRRMQ